MPPGRSSGVDRGDRPRETVHRIFNGDSQRPPGLRGTVVPHEEAQLGRRLTQLVGVNLVLIEAGEGA